MPHSKVEPVSGILSVLVLACVLGGLPGVVPAENARLVVTGNSHLSLDAITAETAKVVCASADSFCVDQICNAVAGAYWAQGYLDAEIKCERSNATGDTVRIAISEGTPSLLVSIKLDGASGEDTPQLDAIFAGRRGIPFSKPELEQAIDDALGFYDGRGYPLARIRPEILEVARGELGVILRISPGPRAKLGRVSFRGMKKTRESVLLRESGLVAGRAYDGDRVDGAREKLLGLGILEEVSEPVLGFDSQDTTVAITFDVAEARTSLFEGVLAYSPGAKGTSLVGSLTLEMLNLGGTLRRAKVLWTRRGDRRLSWSLYYREPQLVGKPLGLEAGLASDVVDTSYARSKFSVGLVFVGEPRLEIGTGAFLGSAKDRKAAGGEGSFRERGLSFSLRYEGRTTPVNPQSGGFFEVSHEVESLDYVDDPALDRTLSNLASGAEYVLGLAGRTKLAFGGRFRGVFSSSGRVPPSHMVRWGGMETLRGYPEEWFNVEKALTLSLEVRRLLGASSRIYAFIDAATLGGAASSFGNLDNLPYGYGFGFMGGTTAGVLRLEIAMGRGDTWSEAKLHLGFVEQF